MGNGQIRRRRLLLLAPHVVIMACSLGVSLCSCLSFYLSVVFFENFSTLKIKIKYFLKTILIPRYQDGNVRIGFFHFHSHITVEKMGIISGGRFGRERDEIGIGGGIKDFGGAE